MKQLFFVKPPVDGAVKTRLASFLGPTMARRIYESILVTLIRNFKGSEVCLYIASEDKDRYFQNNFPDYQQSYQTSGDLGDRMAHAFLESARKWPGQNILLTGSDIPEYHPSIANRANELLNSNDVVLIPSTDGGYTTIGFSYRVFRDIQKAQADSNSRAESDFLNLFNNITWSTNTVLQDQKQKLELSGLRVTLLEALRDLDDARDLYFLYRNGKLPEATLELMEELPGIALLLPVYNEVENLEFVLNPLKESRFFEYIVCADNGSTDGSREKARDLGALVSLCQRRGYGSTCLKGMELLDGYDNWDILLFMDADGSDDPADLVSVLGPVVSNEAELCLGARTSGALLPHQKFGNWLATFLIRWIYGYSYRDLGPFRAINRKALKRLAMDDPDFGWTVQMQIRAVQNGLCIREMPVTSRKRYAGKSKVSATIRGSVLAGWIILRTVFREFLLNKKDSSD